MKKKYPIYVVSVFVVITLAFVAQKCLANDSKISKPSTRIERTDTLYDPLFGIEYHPSEVHFPSAPDDVYKCEYLKMRRGSLFLFAQALKGNIHYYFVYGWMEIHPDGKSDGVRRFIADDDGLIVVVSPSGCRSIGAGYAWYPDKGNRQFAESQGFTFTDEIVSALLSEAVDREVQAFGGKEAFLRRLSATGINESILPEQIRAKLTVLRATKTH
jgi:hypothetical protein